MSGESFRSSSYYRAFRRIAPGRRNVPLPRAQRCSPRSRRRCGPSETSSRTLRNLCTWKFHREQSTSLKLAPCTFWYSASRFPCKWRDSHDHPPAVPLYVRLIEILGLLPLRSRVLFLALTLQRIGQPPMRFGIVRIVAERILIARNGVFHLAALQQRITCACGDRRPLPIHGDALQIRSLLP